VRGLNPHQSVLSSQCSACHLIVYDDKDPVNAHSIADLPLCVCMCMRVLQAANVSEQAAVALLLLLRGLSSQTWQQQSGTGRTALQHTSKAGA